MLRRTGADTKREILTAATRLFSDRGFRGTSLADIAHEIGYSKASVLYHFASKEALLADMIAPAAADLQELLARVSALPPERARRAAIEGYADLTVTYRDAVGILMTGEPLVLSDPHFAAILVVVGTAAACTERADLAPDQLQPALVAVALRALGLPASSPPG